MRAEDVRLQIAEVTGPFFWRKGPALMWEILKLFCGFFADLDLDRPGDLFE
jgi:hypothetical protein